MQAPQNVQIQTGTAGLPYLHWDVDPDAVVHYPFSRNGYVIWRSTSPDVAAQAQAVNYDYIAGEVSGVHFLDPSGATGTLYYCVTLMQNGVQSAPSNVVSITV